MKIKIFYINDGVHAYVDIFCERLGFGTLYIHAKDSQKIKKKTKIPRVVDEGWN